MLEIDPRVCMIPAGMKGPHQKGWPETDTRFAEIFDGPSIGDKYDGYGIVFDSDMVVVDVDSHDGAFNGYHSLGDMERDGCPDLRSICTFRVDTPSGGTHLYFNKDPARKLKKSCDKYPAIDMLSKGCLAIGPGSKGGKYVVAVDEGLPLADLPDWVYENFTSPQRQDEPYSGSGGSTRDTTLVSPIDDFNRSQRGFDTVVEDMRKLGYTVRQTEPTQATFIRPGKTDFTFTISGTIGIRSKSGNIMLRNFSTSDDTFPSDEAITIAHAMRLMHLWDSSQLPRELEGMGYGQSAYDPNFAEKFRAANKVASDRSKLTGKEIEDSYPTVTLDQLLEKNNGARRPYVINKLLRVGEVMNLVAAPKTGKSYMVYNLALALSTSGEWLGYSARADLNVLIVDNELHEEELAHRVKAVSDSMGCKPIDRLHFTCLRGSNVDIDALNKKLDEVGAGRFDIIVIDALYRILPKGASENDNASMTSIYNKLDAIADKNSAAVIVVHHTTKGSQAEKGVTDVGSGAGSIARAADTHLVIRQHAEDGHCVIEAVTRSGKAPDAVTARFDYPLWSLCSDMDPELSDGKGSGRSKQNEDCDVVYNSLLELGPKSSGALHDATKLGLHWSSKTSFARTLKKLEESGRVVRSIPGYMKQHVFTAVEGDHTPPKELD